MKPTELSTGRCPEGSPLVNELNVGLQHIFHRRNLVIQPLPCAKCGLLRQGQKHHGRGATHHCLSVLVRDLIGSLVMKVEFKVSQEYRHIFTKDIQTSLSKIILINSML